jgi:hypothetical protein
MPWQGTAGSQNFTRTTGLYNGSTCWGQTDAAARGIRSDEHDVHDEDLADGISACLKKDGGNTIAGNIRMGGFKITGLGAGSANGESVRYEQVAEVLLEKGTVSNVASKSFALDSYPGYSSYKVIWHSIFAATNAIAFVCDLSTNGGASYLAGTSYDWIHTSDIIDNTSATTATATDESAFWMILSLRSDIGAAGELILYQGSGSVYPWMKSDFVANQAMVGPPASGKYAHCETAGTINFPAAVTDIRFRTWTGNIASGIFSLIGVR